MAWPPPVLPTNQTNATPQADTHPADHARTNQAVNDTVAEVQNLAGSVAALGTSNIILGVDHWAVPRGFQIASNTSVLSTDATGRALITYGVTFAVKPLVMACSGDVVPFIIAVEQATNDPGACWVKAFNHDGTVVANALVRVNWVAFGSA